MRPSRMPAPLCTPATMPAFLNAVAACVLPEPAFWMANALLGNFSSGVTGTAVTTTTVGGNTALTTTLFNPAGVTVRISGGGLGTAQDITFDAASATVDSALVDLTNKVDANAALKAAGITVSGTPGGPLTFTSAHGEK